MNTQTETSVVPTSAPKSQRPVTVPTYRVVEAADGYTVHVLLPGVDKAGVETTVDNDHLTIKATRTWTAPEGWTALHRESSQSDSQLVLELSPEIDPDSVAADLTNGVLKVHLAKAKSRKPRSVVVN